MAKYITDDNVPVTYYDTGGNKPAIIFIHGWTSGGTHWAGIMLGLRQHYRCISLDLRGHGRTPAQGELSIPRLARDVHGLIEHLKLEKPTIVGWSMGGLTTFEYLRQFGHEHLRSVVFVDQTPRLRTDEDWSMGLFGGFTDGHIQNFRDLYTAQQRRVLRRFAMGILHPRRRLLRFASWLIAPYRGGFDPGVLMPLADDMAERDYRDLLPAIDVPVLLCYGGASWLYPGKVGEYLLEHLPNARLVIFEKSGHCPPLEEPVKFVRTLRTFLAA